MATTSIKTYRLCLALIICLALLILASAGMGFISIPAPDVIRIAWAKLMGLAEMPLGIDQAWPYVVWDLRLPRILSAAAVGAGLAVCGVVYQGVLLNPLADPYTLGVSAGAAFGAALAFLIGPAMLGLYTVPVFAFAGAVATLFIVLMLAGNKGRAQAHELVLSGIIVAAILAAGIGFVKHLADEQVSIIIFWLMGSFVGRTWLDVGMVWSAVGVGLMVALYYARDLNVICLGERSAMALGVETGKVRLVLLVTASLVAALCVSVSGIIGFVGLIIPHLVRLMLGPDHKGLVVASALAGAVLLLCADTITRAVLPNEVPIGVLTALIGGPYFCYIFRKKGLGGGRG